MAWTDSRICEGEGNKGRTRRSTGVWVKSLAVDPVTGKVRTWDDRGSGLYNLRSDPWNQ